MYIFIMQFLAQYNILLAQALGAGGSHIGLINLASALAALVISPFIGLVIESQLIRKVMILGLICDLVAMTFFILADHWCLLIPAFVLFGQVVRQLPLTDALLITFTEPDKRATLLGISRILLGTAALFAPIVAAVIVTHYGGISTQGIRPLYYISTLTISLIILLLCKHGKELDVTLSSSGVNKSRISLRKLDLLNEYRDFIKNKKYIKYLVIVRLFRDASVMLLATFIPLWIVNIKGGTAMLLGMLSTISIISGLLIQVPAGKFADKIGRKKTYYLLVTFYCVGIIILILAPTPEYLILAGILGAGLGGVIGGGIGGASFTQIIVMWWEAVSSESRSKLYGLERVIMAIARLLVSLGGILWDLGLKVMVILIPLLMEALIIIPLLHKVPETLRTLAYSSGGPGGI